MFSTVKCGSPEVSCSSPPAPDNVTAVDGNRPGVAAQPQNPSARGCTTPRSVSRGRQSAKIYQIYQIYKNSYPARPERIAAEEQTLPVVAFDRLLRAHLRLVLTGLF